MKVGDHGYIWRERYLDNDQKELLGQKVVVLEVINPAGYWIIMDSGGFSKPLTRVQVMLLGSTTGDTTVVDPRCMTKIKKEVEVGNWEECPWQPAEI